MPAYFAAMAKREILIIPDPVLRKVSAPVGVVDERVLALANDMLDTMYAAPGIGLAAPQVGVLERIVVCDVEQGEHNAPGNPMILINPEVVKTSDVMSVYEEGCLSIPEYMEPVERPEAVTVAYVDKNGTRCEVDADGLLAVCLQHEIDHLNGVLFIDHISRLKRERITKRFQKMAKQAT